MPVIIDVGAIPVSHSLYLSGLDINDFANLDYRDCNLFLNSAFFVDDLDGSIEFPSQSRISRSHGPFFSLVVCIGGLNKVFSFYVAFRSSIETTSLLYTPRLRSTIPKCIRSREGSGPTLLRAVFKKSGLLS